MVHLRAGIGCLRTPDAAIAVEGLSHEFEAPDGALEVLKDVDFAVPAGGRASLAGRSGSGKSTLLTLLGGLRSVQQGSVSVAGVDVAGLTSDELAAFRRETVGFVFQHFGLLDSLTAVENVELAGALSRTPGSARRRRALELLEAVGLTARADHRIQQMSGGERQRVALARALFNRPRVLLADEPTGNLDDETSAAVLTLLDQLSAEEGLTMVLVTHDAAIAARADHHFSLVNGQLSPVVP